MVLTHGAGMSTPPPTPAFGPGPTTMPPPKSNAKRNLGIAVVVVAAVLLLAYIGFLGPAAQTAVSQPSVSMSNLQVSRQLLTCVILIPPQKYWFTFSLSNSGNAAGLVTVDYSIDGSVVQSAQYTISASFTQSETFSLSVNDCASHSASAAIGSVVKA